MRLPRHFPTVTRCTTCGSTDRIPGNHGNSKSGDWQTRVCVNGHRYPVHWTWKEVWDESMKESGIEFWNQSEVHTP